MGRVGLPRLLEGKLIRGGGSSDCRCLTMAAFSSCVTRCLTEVTIGKVSFLVSLLVSAVVIEDVA